MLKKWIWSVCAVFYFVVVSSRGSVGSVISSKSDIYNDNYNYNNSTQFIEGDDDPGYALSSQARSYRKSKFFPLFTIVRFTSEICRTTSEENGICVNKHQCNIGGGLSQGTCAQGLGVCCRFIAQCGGIIVQNGTAFQSPGYPSKYNPSEGASVCQIRVRRQLNVCQLRLNFINFEIDGPSGLPPTVPSTAGTNNDAGTCKTDSLAITSSGGTIPSLCGNMIGQHIYVNYGSSDTVTLNLLLSGNVNRERSWNIEILMIPCNSLTAAPTGCLQYFTGISGQIQSFNFQGSTHLANMDYSSCVRQEDGMRFIDWTPCNPGDVKIGTPALATATAPTMCVVPPNMGALPDFILIMGGISYPYTSTTGTTTQGQVPVSSSDRFCDATWPQTVPSAYVRSNIRPFLLHFRTDGGEVAGGTAAVPADSSQGFCLRWQQNPQ